MRFNRAIGPIKVISFDLDDTLYDNRPIIIAAVNAMKNYLAEIPEWHAQGEHFWQSLRAEVLQKTPSLVNDVSALRRVALTHGFQKLNFDEHDVAFHTEQAYQAFATARSQIKVSSPVMALLAELKQQYRLIAITNGNVDVSQFCLADTFELVLMAGRDGKAKPHSELFDIACQTLAVAPHEILHVGDSLDSDVAGANLAGCHSLWLDNQDIRYRYQGLPCAEAPDVLALKYFL